LGAKKSLLLKPDLQAIWIANVIEWSAILQFRQSSGVRANAVLLRKSGTLLKAIEVIHGPFFAMHKSSALYPVHLNHLQDCGRGFAGEVVASQCDVLASTCI
jgi:hypothetical protein